jgi:hypothetical protein
MSGETKVNAKLSRLQDAIKAELGDDATFMLVWSHGRAVSIIGSGTPAHISAALAHAQAKVSGAPLAVVEVMNGLPKGKRN